MMYSAWSSGDESFTMRMDPLNGEVHSDNSGVVPSTSYSDVRQTPTDCNILEVAALSNNEKEFDRHFRHFKRRKNSSFLNEKQFSRFANWANERKMKTKYLRKFLAIIADEEKLKWKTEGENNSPLHEALHHNFEDEAIKLLRKGASLYSLNNENVRCLDIITPKRLEDHLNDAIFSHQSYYKDLCDPNFSVKLNFRSFVNETNENSELDLLHKIRKNPEFQYLLPHPLVRSFLNLKWQKVKNWFNYLLFVQIFFFVSLTVLFYIYKEFNVPTLVLVVSNVCVKLVFLIIITNDRAKSIIKTHFKSVPLFLWMELITAFTMFFTFLPNDWGISSRAFVFLNMSICLLLTLGYHPKIAKWSVMLQKVFKTFMLLSLFFILPLIAFGLGFNTLFENVEKDSLFKRPETSIFKSLLMIVGEFDASSLQFPQLAAYLLFICYIVGMAMVLMNFWTAVAVSDIEQMARNSKIDAYINVIYFITFVNNITIAYKKLRNNIDSSNPNNLFLKTCKDFTVTLNVKETKLEPSTTTPKFPEKFPKNIVGKIKGFLLDKKTNQVTLQKLMDRMTGIERIMKQQQQQLYRDIKKSFIKGGYDNRTVSSENY